MTRAPVPRETLLARTFVELADSLVDDFDVVELLSVLTDRCVEVLDVDAAGIMLLAPDRALRVMASSSEAMRLLELFELQSEEGPCSDCCRTGQPVVNHDVEGESQRWPRFSPKALQAGFHSVHAVPMRVRGTTIGALNLFCVDAGEMTQTDVDLAQALADVAAIAVAQRRPGFDVQRVNERLQQALNSRIVIEQAKGIVAERLDLTMADAFLALRRFARNQHLRLVDLANAVIDGSQDTFALAPTRQATSSAVDRQVRRG